MAFVGAAIKSLVLSIRLRIAASIRSRMSPTFARKFRISSSARLMGRSRRRQAEAARRQNPRVQTMCLSKSRDSVERRSRSLRLAASVSSGLKSHIYSLDQRISSYPTIAVEKSLSNNVGGVKLPSRRSCNSPVSCPAARFVNPGDSQNIMIMFGSFLPSPLLVWRHKVYSGVEADIVMESFRQKPSRGTTPGIIGEIALQRRAILAQGRNCLHKCGWAGIAAEKAPSSNNDVKPRRECITLRVPGSGV